MAKGTYRMKRLAVLAELYEHDAAWAEQLDALRGTNPQAFRKGILKADVVLSARLGRPTTLSMRPKRFGGDEDPVLVRRVQELRRHQRNREKAIELPPSQYFEGKDEDEVDDHDGFTKRARERMADGPQGQGVQAPTPEVPDRGVDGDKWVQDHTPGFEQGDLIPAEGHRLRSRSPDAGDADIRPDGNRLRSRSPDAGDADIRPEGNRTGRRAPEDRPDLSTVEGAVPPRRSTDTRAAPTAGPDLSFLDGTVGDAKKALAAGDWDDHLDAIEAAEKAGKGRKGVLKAIEARRG